MGLFDKMFDMNHDGKMSTFERVARAAFVFSLFEEEKNSESYEVYNEERVNEEIGEEEPYEAYDEEKVMLEELEGAGVDTVLWDIMDEDEKREAIEDAGLDPYDYDLY